MQKKDTARSLNKSKAPVSHGVGRRKASVARVWLRKGKGKLKVNGKEYTAYFDTDVTQRLVSKPCHIVPLFVNYDVDAYVIGGGRTGQAGAVQLGISRALVALDETLRPLLREHDLLTVDSRVKERKKYGRKAARRSFQFVKR